MNGDDVRVPQARRAAGLAQEPLDGTGRTQHAGTWPFDGHRAPERGIPRPVDDPEGTAADHFTQLITVHAHGELRHSISR